MSAIMLEGREREREVARTMAIALHERHKVFTDGCRFDKERSDHWSKCNSATPSSSSNYSYSSGSESKLKAWQSFLIFTGYMSIFWTIFGLILWGSGMEFKWVAAVVAISFATTGVVPFILLCIISPPYDHDAVIKSKKIRKCVSTIIVWIALFGIWFCFNYGLNGGEIVWHILPWM